MPLDFVIDSSDSEYLHSPKARHVLQNTKTREMPPKSSDTRPFISDETRNAMRSELQAVYDQLNTPRTIKMRSPTLSAAPNQVIRNSYDESRERMKLANIIDSETGADDTADSLFLRPITTQPNVTSPVALVVQFVDGKGYPKECHDDDGRRCR